MNILHEFFLLLAEELTLEYSIEDEVMTIKPWCSARKFALKYFAEYASEYGTACELKLYYQPEIHDPEVNAIVIIKEG